MPLHCAHILQSFLLCFLLHSGRNLGKQAKPLTLRSRSDSKARRSRPSDLAERTKRGVSDSCSVEGCTRFAMVRGSLNGAEQFCGRHRSKCIGSPILRKGLCEASNCSTQATFGSMLDKTRRRCAEHRDPEDTYLVGGGRKCEAEGCFLQPTFGDQTSSRPRFCRQHRSDNHQVVGYASCSVSSCSRRAMYLPANSSTPDACFKHKNTSHTHIFKRCQHPACSNRALFVTRGVDGSGRARKRKCAEHRSNGDVSLGSVVTRRGCQFPEGCTAEPSFGDRLTHGFTPGRKSVSRRRCAAFAGVNPQGLNFGWRAGAKHRRPTDINVVVPRCEASPLCGRMARFGETLEARPRFCSKHRKASHVNLKRDRTGEA